MSYMSFFMLPFDQGLSNLNNPSSSIVVILLFPHLWHHWTNLISNMDYSITIGTRINYFRSSLVHPILMGFVLFILLFSSLNYDRLVCCRLAHMTDCLNTKDYIFLSCVKEKNVRSYLYTPLFLSCPCWNLST